MSRESSVQAQEVERLRSLFGAVTREAGRIAVTEHISTVISEEGIVEKQLALGLLRRGLRVLEVGVGTGYLSARLAEAVGDPRLVHGVDVCPEIVDLARGNLERLGLREVQLLSGDGLLGWPGNEPFDRIILSCAATEFPWHCVRQLAPGGIMVLPLSRGWPIEGLLLAVRVNGEGVEPVAASTGRFVPAQFQQAPPPLIARPAPSFLPGMECQVLLPPSAAAVDTGASGMDWRISDPLDAPSFEESALMRCAALLELHYPHAACFIGARDLSPLGIGLYQEELFGLAAVTFSLDPPDASRFGRIYSLGADGPGERLMELVERASSPSAQWVSGVVRQWSEASPWLEG